MGAVREVELAAEVDRLRRVLNRRVDGEGTRIARLREQNGALNDRLTAVIGERDRLQARLDDLP